MTLAIAPDAVEFESTVGRAEMLAVGMTYRQLDYWTTKGHLRAVGQGNPASGAQRRWPLAELWVAAVMVALTRGGFDPAAAERVARHPHLEVVPGVRLHVDSWAALLPAESPCQGHTPGEYCPVCWQWAALSYQLSAVPS